MTSYCGNVGAWPSADRDGLIVKELRGQDALKWQSRWNGTCYTQRSTPDTAASMTKWLNARSGLQKLTKFYAPYSSAHSHQDGGGSRYSALALTCIDTGQIILQLGSTGPVSLQQIKGESTPPDSPTTCSPTKSKKANREKMKLSHLILPTQTRLFLHPSHY